MIHEGKLNDALSKLFFSLSLTPALHASTSDDLRNRLSSSPLSDSQFISRTLCYELSFSPFLSVYLSILFICLPVYLPSRLSCHFSSFLTNHFVTISLIDNISDLNNAFWRFIKNFLSVANGIHKSRINV